MGTKCGGGKADLLPRPPSRGKDRWLSHRISRFRLSPAVASGHELPRRLRSRETALSFAVESVRRYAGVVPHLRRVPVDRPSPAALTSRALVGKLGVSVPRSRGGDLCTCDGRAGRSTRREVRRILSVGDVCPRAGAFLVILTTQERSERSSSSLGLSGSAVRSPSNRPAWSCNLLRRCRRP